MQRGVRCAAAASDTHGAMIDPVTDRLMIARTFAPPAIAPIARVAGGVPPMPDPRARDRFEASAGREPLPRVTYGARSPVYPAA